MLINTFHPTYLHVFLETLGYDCRIEIPLFQGCQLLFLLKFESLLLLRAFVQHRPFVVECQLSHLIDHERRDTGLLGTAPCVVRRQDLFSFLVLATNRVVRVMINGRTQVGFRFL